MSPYGLLECILFIHKTYTYSRSADYVQQIYGQTLLEGLIVCSVRKEGEPATVTNVINAATAWLQSSFEHRGEVGVINLALSNWRKFRSGYAIQVRAWNANKSLPGRGAAEGRWAGSIAWATAWRWEEDSVVRERQRPVELDTGFEAGGEGVVCEKKSRVRFPICDWEVGKICRVKRMFRGRRRA